MNLVVLKTQLVQKMLNPNRTHPHTRAERGFALWLALYVILALHHR